jgi:hypothetical protein
VLRIFAKPWIETRFRAKWYEFWSVAIVCKIKKYHRNIYFSGSCVHWSDAAATYHVTSFDRQPNGYCKTVQLVKRIREVPEPVWPEVRWPTPHPSQPSFCHTVKQDVGRGEAGFFTQHPAASPELAAWWGFVFLWSLRGFYSKFFINFKDILPQYWCHQDNVLLFLTFCNGRCVVYT